MFKKYGLGLLVIVLAVGAVAFTEPTHKSGKPPTTYFFEYVGSPGNEQTPSLWQYLPSGQPACGKTNDGCLIEVKDTYTMSNGGTRILNVSNVPVVISGTHKNPDVSSEMIVNASNRNN
jgi:hypothetical protein